MYLSSIDPSLSHSAVYLADYFQTPDAHVVYQTQAQGTYAPNKELATASSASTSADNNANKATISTIVIAGQHLSFAMLEKFFAKLGEPSLMITVRAQRYHARFGKSVLTLKVSHSPELDIASSLSDLSHAFCIDVFMQSTVSLAQKGLVVFDMDSTIIEMECIDEIAKLAGVGEQVAEVTERAMRGEIAFSESLHYRVACLEGVSLDSLLQIRERLPFICGFADLVGELKAHDWRVVIASGGFTYFADYIKAAFLLDAAHSNTLEVKNGLLTGKVLGNVVDAQAKAQVLLDEAQTHGINMANTIAVGDGANDLVMMDKAGVGVAYRAKPAVQEKAQANIRYSGLEATLYVLR